MPPDIKQKLTNVVTTGITTEALAVYFMVQIRKLLESQNAEGYEYLRFYCNWALHPMLNNPTAQKVLREFETEHLHLKGKVRVGDLPEGIRGQIEKISGMRLFREELNRFLKSNSLPTVDEGRDGWAKFIYLYSHVIADCPLEIKPFDEESEIESVTVSVEDATEQIEGENFYRICWMIIDKNRQTGVIDIYNSFSADR